jgi:hypothetical protein
MISTPSPITATYVEGSMSKRASFAFAAALTIAGASAAAVALETPPPPLPVDHACLAIGSGVCFSGTTAWVARAAETETRPYAVMLAMAGDAF